MLSKISRPLLFPAIIGLMFIVTGCETTRERVRWYDGPPVETNKVALLKIQNDFFAIVLTVGKIDGQSITKGKNIGNYATEIELLPGKHSFMVSYRDGNGNRSVADVQISFVAEAGRVYEMHAAPVERSFGKTLRQELLFQDGYWTLCVVDSKTQAVVAGTPRTTPLRWYE